MNLNKFISNYDKKMKKLAHFKNLPNLQQYKNYKYKQKSKRKK